MKIEKSKVLLYLKKSGMDKNRKAPIMGRITVNRTMAQFSCKLSKPRANRLEGKSKEAVETNKDIEQLLLSIQKAFDVLVEKRTDFEAKDVKEALQGSVKTPFPLRKPMSRCWRMVTNGSSITARRPEHLPGWNSCPRRWNWWRNTRTGKRYPFPIAEHESCSYRSHHHLQVGGNEQDLFLPFGESQQNLLLIDYQQIKYNKECNC